MNRKHDVLALFVARDAANQSLESRVGAAVSAAEAMGAIAGAALSAQNTLAEIGNNTLTTTSS